VTHALMENKLDAELQSLLAEGAYTDIKAIFEEVEEKRKHVRETRGTYPLYVH
jgi:hypothetical protein